MTTLIPCATCKNHEKQKCCDIDDGVQKEVAPISAKLKAVIEERKEVISTLKRIDKDIASYNQQIAEVTKTDLISVLNAVNANNSLGASCVAVYLDVDGKSIMRVMCNSSVCPIGFKGKTKSVTETVTPASNNNFN